jgi:hypothetical protein
MEKSYQRHCINAIKCFMACSASNDAIADSTTGSDNIQEFQLNHRELQRWQKTSRKKYIGC